MRRIAWQVLRNDEPIQMFEHDTHGIKAAAPYLSQLVPKRSRAKTLIELVTDLWDFSELRKAGTNLDDLGIRLVPHQKLHCVVSSLDLCAIGERKHDPPLKEGHRGWISVRTECERQPCCSS